MARLKNRIGEININNQGLKMRIIRYGGSQDIDIEFEDDYIAYNKRYDVFKNGQINSPYFKSVCGVGYFGDGIYKSKINRKDTIEYKHWSNMIHRCYDKTIQEKQPYYKGCTVCEEWHNFQNFAKWFNDNYYQINHEAMCLDKDILHKGNKIYSPNTCCFVNNRINVLFTKNTIKRGNYPIGVSYHKEKKRFEAKCSIFFEGRKINKFLGGFNDPIVAFNAYKQFKELYIKQVADEYKEVIPIELYEAMYRYKVEITD